MRLEQDIQDIINELYERNIVSSNNLKIKKLSGTTEGLVYKLTETNDIEYVVKIDRSEDITLTQQILQTYEHSILFPKLLFTDPLKSYIVYSYIKGTTHFNRGKKKNWLTILVKELLNHYEITQQTDIWGRVEFPCHSWREFNDISIKDARSDIGSIIPVEDYYMIESLVEKLFDSEFQDERYLLHGDTGVHNFVFDQNSLIGVIDPSSMIGPVLYDFIYAFCSSPDDINEETLFAAYDLLEYKSIERSRLIEEVAIQLYCRIGICLRHHPDDLVEYLAAWEYWKGLLVCPASN